MMQTVTSAPRHRSGFMRIAILIVVVNLGILAAVIIPQFTNAADDASISLARTPLQTMRSQIELYRAQNGLYPTADGSTQAPMGTVMVPQTSGMTSLMATTCGPALFGRLCSQRVTRPQPAI